MVRETCHSSENGFSTKGKAAFCCGKCRKWFHKNCSVADNNDIPCHSVCEKCKSSEYNKEVMAPTSNISKLLLKVAALEERVKKISSLEHRISVLQDRLFKLNLDHKVNEPQVPPFAMNKILMKKGDLLMEAESNSIAHCISQDYRMSDGIAKLKKEKFHSNKSASWPKVPVGSVIRQSNGDHSILHLVTNEKAYDKPTWKKTSRKHYNNCLQFVRNI